jgi:hypothetical protein
MEGFQRPRGVAHTPGGVVVVWGKLKRNETLVVGYKLVQDSELEPFDSVSVADRRSITF